ncbi:TetR family transcriptional regulator [Sorangium cellulosum]|uniref:TetR family transcriptional regulator n=1 Tax=Sorangium cellulosum TaxID=56 RepID=A0A150SB74_SORCE|nr:TetR family transcriptional regulator [Sorangium cellulosum]
MNKSSKKSGNETRDRGGDRTRAAGKIADRRVQKTRKLLSDALVSLILEKGYDEVSIQDIIDRANVGRSTFYSHYENKEQLLLFGHEHLRALSLRDAGRPLDFLPFYRHLAEMHELVRKLLSAEKSERVLTRSLEDILQGSICRLYAPRMAPEEGALFMLRSEAAAAALVRLMTSWVHKGMPCSPERMAEESTALLQRVLADERAAASGRTRKE